MVAWMVVVGSVAAVVGCWAFFVRRNLPDLLSSGGLSTAGPSFGHGQRPLDDAPAEMIDQLARSLRRGD